jgi:hypothetical protein
VLLCFACVEILCAFKLVHQSGVFYSSALQFSCVVPFSLCRSQWNGCAKASRTVLVLQYCLAILLVFCKSLLVDRIVTVTTSWPDASWIVGFARNIVFFRVRGGSVAEKSWLMRATVLGVVALAWNHVLRHFVHWNPCVKAMCSTEVYCVVEFSSGMAAPQAARMVLVLQYRVLRFWLWFASPYLKIRKSYFSGCVKVANGALAAFWRWWFSFSFFWKCDKIAVFPLERRDPVLELQFV